jgi:hypothetical protein
VEESVEHAFLFCPFAREVWTEIKKDFDVSLQRMSFLSPKIWLMDFMSRSSEIQGIVLAVTCWHLWDTRNKIREEGGQAVPLGIAAKIKAYIEFIMTYQLSTSSNHRREATRVVSWSPPPDGFLQLSVDAALFASSKSMGAGVVVRDQQGTFVAAAGDNIHDVVNPDIAEACAIRFALSWAQDEGMDHIVVNTYCLSVVQRIDSSEKDLSAIGPIFQDIKLLVAGFTKCSVIFVSRLQNFAAHYLARSLEFSSKSIWRGVPPGIIREAICIDSMFK